MHVQISADLGFNAMQKLGLTDIEMPKYDGGDFLSTPIVEMWERTVMELDFLLVLIVWLLLHLCPKKLGLVKSIIEYIWSMHVHNV